MVHNCIVTGCKYRKRKNIVKGIVFHSFPADPVRLAKWEAVVANHCPKPINITRHSKICQFHFLNSDYAQTKESTAAERDANKTQSKTDLKNGDKARKPPEINSIRRNTRHLKPTAIPSVFEDYLPESEQVVEDFQISQFESMNSKEGLNGNYASVRCIPSNTDTILNPTHSSPTAQYYHHQQMYADAGVIGSPSVNRYNSIRHKMECIEHKPLSNICPSILSKPVRSKRKPCHVSNILNTSVKNGLNDPNLTNGHCADISSFTANATVTTNPANEHKYTNDFDNAESEANVCGTSIDQICHNNTSSFVDCKDGQHSNDNFSAVDSLCWKRKRNSLLATIDTLRNRRTLIDQCPQSMITLAKQPCLSNGFSSNVNNNNSTFPCSISSSPPSVLPPPLQQNTKFTQRSQSVWLSDEETLNKRNASSTDPSDLLFSSTECCKCYHIVKANPNHSALFCFNLPRSSITNLGCTDANCNERKNTNFINNQTTNAVLQMSDMAISNCEMRTQQDYQLYHLLNKANLIHYYKYFLSAGGDDVIQLCQLSKKDLNELIHLVGMDQKPFHVKRLKKAISRLRLKLRLRQSRDSDLSEIDEEFGQVCDTLHREGNADFSRMNQFRSDGYKGRSSAPSSAASTPAVAFEEDNRSEICEVDTRAISTCVVDQFRKTSPLHYEKSTSKEGMQASSSIDDRVNEVPSADSYLLDKSIKIDPTGLIDEYEFKPFQTHQYP